MPSTNPPAPLPMGVSRDEDEVVCRFERFASLVAALTVALKKTRGACPDCESMGWEEYTDEDFRRALACAVTDLVGKPRDPDADWYSKHRALTLQHLHLQYDEAAIEGFIGIMRQALDPQRHFHLYR